MATTPQAKTLTRLIQPSLSWLRTSTYVPVDLRRSMSGGASDSDGKKAASASDGDRPLSNSPSVKATRLASASSLSEPTYLGNSMSDGVYEPRRRAQYVPHNSMSDPMDAFLQNSLAGESNYHLPAALQNRRGGIPKAQGFSTGKARPTLQRIVVRTSIHDAEPLGNSYSDAEYVPRRR
ncbi:hypothetical protein ACKKBG_A29190 [Auxenochlorella protothecoides x Auxenochlorella symbiontica]